jgi:hypothetical protein
MGIKRSISQHLVPIQYLRPVKLLLRIMGLDYNKTTVVLTPGRGRILLAGDSFQPGVPIIKIEDPYLAIPEVRSLSTHCAECFTSTPRPKRCNRCHVTAYCSKPCQIAAWHAGHKYECGQFRAISQGMANGRPIPTVVRALIRILDKHTHGCDPDPNWSGLTTHVENLRSDRQRWIDLNLQVEAALRFAGKESSWRWMALGLICRVSPLFNSPLLFIQQKPQMRFCL